MTSLETGETVPSLQLGIPAMSTIMILDDDHGGVFCFEEHEAEITESVGTFELKVIYIYLSLIIVKLLWFGKICLHLAFKKEWV